MYLKSISLTNFRQFGIVDSDEPAITIHLNKNFNVLVGENDSGKTAIIDAIRYLLGSVSEEYQKIELEDFHRYTDGNYSEYFYIEGIFVNLSDREAGAFLDWLSFDEQNEYQLRISLRAERIINENGQEYIIRKVQAGDKSFEKRIDGEARNLLKTTYLKPLRDASIELKPGFRSRLAQILKVHPAFKDNNDESVHELVEVMESANKRVEEYFKNEYQEGRSLVSDLEELLSYFYDEIDQGKSKSIFSISKTDLISILRKLSLDTEEVNLGLGNLNLLFIATELLLLKDHSVPQIIGPQITLIEEIEAHLHTQAQIRLIKYLEEELNRTEYRNQFILTSHSSNLVSSIDPQHIILIYNKIAYPFREEYTNAEKKDYAFLERFLDSTKSNLFFAKGLILVEGNSEMLLLPALANLIGYPLHKNGISLVNVGGTSFERYIKLFSRSELWINDMNYPVIDTPISIITDIDVKPMIYYNYEDKTKYFYSIENEEELEKVLLFCDRNDNLTKEYYGYQYSTIKKLAKDFNLNIIEDNEDSVKNIVKKSINEESIKLMTLEKHESLHNKYSQYNTNFKKFIAPDWTLEYTLALSELAPLLLDSIHELRYKNPYSGKNKDIYDQLKNELEDFTFAREEIAYKMFKPLNDGIVSKAEVAQLMAIKINNILKSPDSDEVDRWNEKVKSDAKLTYLIESILHSAKKEMDRS